MDHERGAFMTDAYLKAKRLGEKAVAAAQQNGASPHLPFLDHDTLNCERVGICDVSADLIVGSRHERRAEDFAPNFMPILDASSELAAKWSRLYDIQMEEGIRDPVKVYEYRWKFYVEEGNKRVSVLKFLDVPTIDCDIIRVLPEEQDPAYDMFRRFFRCTRTYLFRFEKAASYEELASRLGMDLDSRWPSLVTNRLIAAYYRFRGLFTEGLPGREQESLDAFLGYLSLYPMDSLLDLSKPVLKKRILALGEDLPELAKDESIEVTDHPVEKETSLIQNIVTKITTPSFTENTPLKVAFVYRKDSGESAWAAAHEKARLEAEKSFGGRVRTFAYENTQSDDETGQAIEEAIAAGAHVIITVSAEDFLVTLAHAADHPEIHFCNCSLRQLQRSVLCFYPKTYEAKFLMGALAAVFAEDHKIGLLADYPLYGIISDINAFALGASFIDPKSQVYLKWATLKDSDWRTEMRKDGLNVISGHAQTKPYWTAEEQGLFLRRDEGNLKLATLEINWSAYYRLILQDILDGKDNRLKKNTVPVNYWFGLSSGIVDVELSDLVPPSTKELIRVLKESIIEGRLMPFSGELRNQAGTAVPVNDGTLTTNEIIDMQWLNENVHGSIPSMDAFVDSAETLLQASGIWNE